MMALSDEDKKALEEVVAANGNCLSAERCKRCPFKALCLPEFLNPKPPTQPQRLEMALEVLSHHYLVDEEMTAEDLKDYSRWKPFNESEE
jgi:hypothetical protein